MKRHASIFALGALAALGLGSVNAVAQTSTDAVVFETIDTYALGSAGTSATTLSVTGVVQGTTAPTTQTFNVDSAASAASCDRMMAVAMNRPGRFLITVERSVNSNAFNRSCRLTRRP